MVCHALFGGLGLTDAWGGWGVWRFVETGDGDQVFITSWTHHEYVLSSSPDGKVSTTKHRGASEKWIVQKSPNGNGVELVSAFHGKRLACDGRGLYTMDETNTPSLVWQLESAHKGVYFLSSTTHDRRISCGPLDDGPIVPFLSKSYDKGQEWKVDVTPDGSITLCSKKFGLYLGCNGTDKLTTSSVAGQSERWRLESAPNGSVHLVSNSHEMQLACDEEGRLSVVSTDDGPGDDISWQLVPRLPESTTASQVGTRIATAAACAIAMPFAVMGVVGMMGFTSAGITAGSVGAGMMSAEAIAAGGGVVAGGTVATLQSIGAVGLGFTGTSASIVGGGVIGGWILAAVAAGSAATPSIDTGADPQDMDDAMTPNRPFCAWRSW